MEPHNLLALTPALSQGEREKGKLPSPPGRGLG